MSVLPREVEDFVAAASLLTVGRSVSCAGRPLLTGQETAGRPGGLRAAIAHTTLAAQAIWKRDRIDAERYRALVGPFRDVGIGVPDRE